MEIPVELLQESANHRKTCQTCTKRVLCDEAAQINLKLLEASFK